MNRSKLVKICALLAGSWLVVIGGDARAVQRSVNRLIVEGPELRPCEITVRYFRARQLTKSLTTRIALQNGQFVEELETGFDGIEVYVQTPAFPLKGSLVIQDKVVDDTDLQQPGLIKLSSGKVGRAEYQPGSIDLNKNDIKLVEAFHQARERQSTTEALISSLPSAEVDAPCLDVFLRELTGFIGPSLADKQLTAGWMAWSEAAGTRILAGALQGQSGVCGLRLTAVGGKISRVEMNCPVLPDNYFREPLDTTSYVQQAETLTRALFAGKAEQAHKMYAPAYQEQVKVEQLAQLCEQLRQRYGQTIESCELKRHYLLAYNFQQRSQVLHIDLIVRLDNGVRCTSRVVFNIPSSRNQVGRAQLGAINVVQAFQSSHSSLAKATQKLLQDLGRGMESQALVNNYPERLQAMVNQPQTQALLDRLSKRLGDSQPEIDFDLWSVNGFQDWLQASGPVRWNHEDYYAEIQFVGDDRWLGMSIYGPAVAESTLDLFDFAPQIPEAARMFWQQLLGNQVQAAHGMLDQEFQQQLPLADLQKQLDEDQRLGSPVKSVVVDRVRLSNNVFRPQAVVASVFLTAVFDSGNSLPLTCDLSWPTDTAETATLLVTDFSSEFANDFPVSSIPLAEGEREGAQAAIDAFMQTSVEPLLALVDPQQRQHVDRAALTAYLQQLKLEAGNMQSPVSIARTVEYEPGSQRYRCNAILVGEKNLLPIEVWFHAGYLERFTIAHPPMDQFPMHLTDTSEIERRIETFIKHWFDDLNSARQLMVPSLYSEAFAQALLDFRQQFVSQCGALEDFDINKIGPVGGGGGLEYEVTLKGANNHKVVDLIVEVGAFGGLVSSVSF
ncbi:MAG: hypothetical protein KF752_04540 [Pirellulaceae bacterium]|nr:hypothetical protein [Pirellulaceae bacterium]